MAPTNVMPLSGKGRSPALILFNFLQIHQQYKKPTFKIVTLNQEEGQKNELNIKKGDQSPFTFISTDFQIAKMGHFNPKNIQ
jgi:hypothetical protein